MACEEVTSTALPATVTVSYTRTIFLLEAFLGGDPSERHTESSSSEISSMMSDFIRAVSLPLLCAREAEVFTAAPDDLVTYSAEFRASLVPMRFLATTSLPVSPAVVFSSELFVSESDTAPALLLVPFCMDRDLTGPFAKALFETLVSTFVEAASKSVSELLTQLAFSEAEPAC